MKLMELYNSYLAPASDTLLDLGSGGFRWRNIYSSGSLNTQFLITSNLMATSAIITSQVFVKSVGSSLALSNSANSYLNVKILTHNAASILSGDVYFFASSNRVYLAINSQSATYYVAMNT